MKAIRTALKTVGASRRAYIFVNLVYYSLIICAMVYAGFNRSLQQSLLDAVGDAFAVGPLSSVESAYSGGQVLLAIALTSLVNLMVGSFASITLPSLVIPFSGLLIGGCRAILWGLLFSPTMLEIGGTRIIAGFLVLILILLEGQGYILTMLAAYIQGRALLLPKCVGAASHRQGYWLGVKDSIRIYLLVVLVLALAAVYEGLIVIFVLPQLGLRFEPA